MAELTRASVEAEIHALIQEFSTVENLELTGDMPFEAASVSSLDVLQVVFRLEETHGVEIDTTAFDQVKTIDDIVDYIVTVWFARSDAV
jgi:acyl carrier protein